MLSEVIVGMDERGMKDVTGHVLYFWKGKFGGEKQCCLEDCRTCPAPNLPVGLFPAEGARCILGDEAPKREANDRLILPLTDQPMLPHDLERGWQNHELYYII